ncbi:MAG TPA: prepilin-type N-terminal cleavage/methylation domain-containing protein [Rhodoblastus sp.]|nr:prepilin-type N-terminal cleavage/methylation domain-containing protein [Rhodoblastus sp.]
MRRRARDGFTLLELLVALGLVSMMVAALVGGLRLGTRAWESGRVSASLDEMELAARAAAAQIERAFPANVRRVDGPPTLAFEGGPDFCRFAALSEGDAQYGGLVTTEIGADGGVLAAFTKVFREDAFSTPRADMRETALLQNLVFVRLSYFGATELAAPESWRDDWRDASLLPRLVKLRIGARRGNAVVETAVTVALRQK